MTEVAKPDAALAPRRRWVMPVLIASLALNLLVAGAMAGWAWRHGPGGHGGRHGGPDRILWLLPDAKRDQARAIIDRYRQSDAGRDTERTASQAAVLSALTAEPFQRPALEQSLSRLGSAELSRRLDPAMLGEIAAILTLDERKELAASLKKIMERRGRWRD
jgi:uncharacterized membrane protein